MSFLNQAGTDKQTNKGDLQKEENNFVGERISKEFDGIVYSGTISKFLHDVQYWVVKYDDGDTEEMDKDQIGIALEMHKKVKNKSGKDNAEE